MRILIAWPPTLPSYFNAGHRMAMFQIAEFLRRRIPEAEVVVRDFGALNCTWKEVADTLATSFDAVIIQNDFDAATGFARFIRYCRALSPQSLLLTFGRLSARVPGFFDKYGLDAIVVSGDPELGVLRYMEAYSIGSSGDIPGLRLAVQSNKTSPGEWLDPIEWALPNCADVPYESYQRLYARDANKFCGLSGQTELVIPVARGCPVGCYFCEVPSREGYKDRRLPVQDVINYAVAARKQFRYDYVSMYAPTFTLRESWVMDLCERLIGADVPFLWKCTTTIAHLSPQLISMMGRAGCVRISVGLESAEPAAQLRLPAIKRTALASVYDVNEWCNAAGVELTCFIVLGMPGSSAREMLSVVEQLQEQDIRVRPTIYADYSLLREDMSEAEVDSLNRQVQDLEGSEEDIQLLYRIYFGDVLRPSLPPRSVLSSSNLEISS